MTIYNIPSQYVSNRIDHYGRLGYHVISVRYNGLNADVTFAK